MLTNASRLCIRREPLCSYESTSGMRRPHNGPEGGGGGDMMANRQHRADEISTISRPLSSCVFGGWLYRSTEVRGRLLAAREGDMRQPGAVHELMLQ